MNYTLDFERPEIRSVDYQAALARLCPIGSEEEWKDYRAFLEAEWFDLYVEDLERLGFVSDGYLETYEWRSFSYSYDLATKPDHVERWESVHRENLRIVCVHGFSTPTDLKRDSSRLRYHANTLPREFGATRNELPFDKGHFMAHTVGGEIDNGIFAQRRDVNRGWGSFGKVYRAMECYGQDHPGSFMFCRPIYGDGSMHPFYIEYGVLRTDREWWVEFFPNRYTYTPYAGPNSWPDWRKKSFR